MKIIVPKNTHLSILAFLFSTFFNLSVAEVDQENVCFLYATKNFSGEAILSLPSSIKVFETNLIFRLKPNSKGITILSAKLSRPECSVILCDKKHLKGACTEITESITDLSSSIDLSSVVNTNILSVDCHCPEPGAKEDGDKEAAGEIATSQLEDSVLLSTSSSDKVKSLQEEPCATLFRDWHFKGQTYPILFPGSTGRIDLGAETPRIRSVSVKNGCSVVIWGNEEQYSQKDLGQIKTLPLTKSTSFLHKNISKDIEWACCYCDQCSESVCKSAQSTSKNLSQNSGSTINHDFSQFVKYGKKIIGIGRNYRWKKVELASVLAIPKEPIVFLKPTTSYITEGEVIELPESLGTIFYELELGIVIGKRGRNVSENDALDHVAGYFLALDMTAKEFIKGKGNQSHPWEIGKGFDTACPVGNFIPKSFIPDPNNIELECKVNGEVTQMENTREMIFNVRQLISYVSRYMTLEPFDTILTGTPDGFGPVKEGDVIEGKLGNLTSIHFTAVLSPA